MQRSNIVISGQAALLLQQVLEDSLMSHIYHFLQTYAHPQLFFPADWAQEPSMQVLDVACRNGAWTCDLAQQYPLIHVVGVEERRTSVEAARMAAALAGLENVTIVEGGLLGVSSHQENTYRVVRAMFFSSAVSQEQEEALVREMVRVCAHGGSLVLFEFDLPQTNSAAWNQWMAQVGPLFLSSRDQQKERLASFQQRLLLAGCQHVEHIVQELSLSAGTAAHSAICEQSIRLFDVSCIFLLAYEIMTSEQLMDLRRRILLDILDPQFEGKWTLFTLLADK